MFPLSINGSVRLKFEGAVSDRRVKAVAQRIAKMLRDATASHVSVDGNQVEFTVDMFRPARPWHILFPYNSGRLWVEPKAGAICLRYGLSTRRLMTAVAVFVSLLGIVMLGVTEAAGPLLLAVILSTAWLCLFTLSYLFAMLHFRRWLRKGLRGIPELRNAPPNVKEDEPVSS